MTEPLPSAEEIKDARIHLPMLNKTQQDPNLLVKDIDCPHLVYHEGHILQQSNRW